MSRCPFAEWRHSSGQDSHPSFAIRAAKGEPPYFTCFSCHSNGPLSNLTEELRFLSKGPQVKYRFGEAVQYLYSYDEDEDEYVLVTDKYAAKADPVVEFPEEWIASFIPATSSPLACEYLQYRGVTWSTAVALDLKFDPVRKAVVFPVRDFQGRLVGARGRYLYPTPHGSRYHDYPYKGHSNTGLVWLGEDRVEWKLPLVVVEGNFDFTSVRQVYPNVVAGMTANVSSEKIARIQPAWKVLSMADNNEAGDLLTSRLSSRLAKTTVVTKVQYEGSDPGSLNADYLAWVLNNSLSI